MADLNTPEQVDAELSATTGWRWDATCALAKRRVDALGRSLDFATAGNKNGQSFEFDRGPTEREIARIEAFIVANGGTTQDATQSADCVFPDFSSVARF